MITLHLPEKEWNKRDVIRYILGCRETEGLPIFKTKFAGLQLKADKGNAVLFICWGGRETEEPSVVFTNVPREDINFLEEGYSDWKRLLDKWATPEEKAKAMSGGIYLKGWKLPKIF